MVGRFSLSCAILFAVIVVISAGCGGVRESAKHGEEGGTVSDATERDVQPVRQVRIVPRPDSWAIWLQKAQPQVVAASATDLVVVDYSADGTDAHAFTPAEVALMQRGGRKVLCYFSIGEAESYRFYWNAQWKEAPPAFLGAENPDWPENYKVKYWHEQWWDLALKPYMDRILAAGFDGVYLDIVDAYWYWFEQGRELETCASDMIRLVVRIGNYLRQKGGADLIICPQNAEGIFNDAPEEAVTRYLKAIDMIGVESLLFNVTPEDSTYRTEMLARAANAGKFVLNIEYIPLERMDEYRRALSALPFAPVPYRAEPDRALDGLASQRP
ncbi:endo alpha-1,4 polygalactosaminidase [Desulfovibrio mangrovi]|uniref:MJ1477/TM1410 family putative glycoside hydrolase n=1 Tax=Desulfovibrio mangrovi TaxID=2976983 RepID=UPI002246FB3F|nr:MJ1477/TM1410 family putative glycoside hydrolase [Desulfovibrio mangrovi]UZP67402.1 endo alpha-1,4 polygalactosaminidase [Desulfovibrio mangrovi]